MTIPEELKKDVLEDLATLYLSGEATAGTRILLEGYAREQPEFAARLRQAGAWEAPLPPAAIQADAEVRTLERTRMTIRLKTIFTAMGIAFTLLPFSFRGGKQGLQMLFWPDQDGLIIAFWSVAAASWVAAWVMRRDLRRRGL